VLVIKIAVLLVFLLSGYFIGLKYNAFIEGTAIGLLCGILSFLLERAFRKVSLGRVVGALAGLVTGIVFANLLLLPLRRISPDISLAWFILNSLF